MLPPLAEVLPFLTAGHEFCYGGHSRELECSGGIRSCRQAKFKKKVEQEPDNLTKT